MRRLVCSFILLAAAAALSSCSARREASASADRVALARETVTLLSKGDYTSVVERFDDQMRSAMPEGKLKQVWEQLIAWAGPMRKQVDAKLQRVQGFDVVLVTCEFEKAALDLQVTLNPDGKIGGLYIRPRSEKSAEYAPPSYVKAGSFRQREVIFGTGAWAVPGTLTLPIGAGPFPGIVLVHGSGPQDRDETVGPNKPFRDLAWGLAGSGIATLRYEKRTFAHSDKMLTSRGSLTVSQTLTVKEEVVDDALAAIALLRKQKEIDPDQVFLLGHSLGGTLGPMIAARDTGLRGLIVMAGAARPLEDLVVEQLTYLHSLNGPMTGGQKQELAELRQDAERIKHGRLSASSGEMLAMAPASYWLSLRGYEPARAASSLKLPMLVLQGGRDYQVTKADFERWKRSLSGRAYVTFRLYPDLNHLFAKGKGKATPREYERAGHVDGRVVSDVARWVNSYQ